MRCRADGPWWLWVPLQIREARPEAGGRCGIADVRPARMAGGRAAGSAHLKHAFPYGGGGSVRSWCERPVTPGGHTILVWAGREAP